jgi:hypothetical protein
MSKALLSEALLGRVPGAALPRIVASRGHDLIDQTGSRYLDAISGAYAAILGYDLMSTVEVMTSAAEKLPYVHNARFDTDESAALAQRLSDLAGDPGYHVYFSVSGADGVEAALRIAAAAGRVRAGRSRTALASLGYSYHGSTGFALSATGHAAARSGYAGHLKPVHRLDLVTKPIGNGTRPTLKTPSVNRPVLSSWSRCSETPPAASKFPIKLCRRLPRSVNATTSFLLRTRSALARGGRVEYRFLSRKESGLTSSF